MTFKADYRYVVNAGLIASISQEKQNNLPATPILFTMFIQLISQNKKAERKHCEGKECRNESAHDQSKHATLRRLHRKR